VTESLREIRLKPEFADQYPAIVPEVWMPAAELAKKLIERAYTGRREGRHTRTFDPTHFEFRGGYTGPRSRTRRTRSTDQQGRSRGPGTGERLRRPPDPAGPGDLPSRAARFAQS
jgi:hypothetical protein